MSKRLSFERLARIALIVGYSYGFLYFILLRGLDLDFNALQGILLYIFIAGTGLLVLREMEKRILAKSGLWLLIALILGYWGWYMQPDQIYYRALDRFLSMESILKDYRSGNPPQDLFGKPNTPEEIQTGLIRASQELAARKMEYEAAKIRYNGDPVYYRSTFHVWSLWGLASVSLLQAISILMSSGNLREVLKEKTQT